MNQNLTEQEKAFKNLEYAMKSFVRSATEASTAFKHLHLYFDQYEAIRKEKRRLKRLSRIEKVNSFFKRLILPLRALKWLSTKKALIIAGIMFFGWVAVRLLS